jgi:hypothetical protein
MCYVGSLRTAAVAVDMFIQQHIMYCRQICTVHAAGKQLLLSDVYSRKTATVVRCVQQDNSYCFQVCTAGQQLLLSGVYSRKTATVIRCGYSIIMQKVATTYQSTWCLAPEYTKLNSCRSPLPKAQYSLVGQSILIIEVLQSHSDTPHSFGLLWMNDQTNADTHNTHRRKKFHVSGGIFL